VETPECGNGATINGKSVGRPVGVVLSQFEPPKPGQFDSRSPVLSQSGPQPV